MKSKLDTDIDRGIKAQAIMSDPLMVEAREHIESELWRLFKSAVPTDFEALSQIKSMQYMHAKYETFLKTCINDGKMATLEVERKKKSLKERFLG
jgi:hypothetical protein